MRSGRVEEAEALAKLVGKCISRNNQSRLLHINGRTDAKNMWAAVRQITGSRRSTGQTADVTAEVLNNHYAVISNDDCYIPPMKKNWQLPTTILTTFLIGEFSEFLTHFVQPPPASMIYQRGSLINWALQSSVNKLHICSTSLSLLLLFRSSGSEPSYDLFHKFQHLRNLKISGRSQSRLFLHASWNEPFIYS